MEALGTLAGGVAPTSTMRWRSSPAGAERPGRTSRLRTACSRTLKSSWTKAGARAKELAQQILAFARQEKTRREITSLTQLVEDSVSLSGSVRRRRCAGAELRAGHPADPGRCDTDEQAREPVHQRLAGAGRTRTQPIDQGTGPSLRAAGRCGTLSAAGRPLRRT